ncbi:MAG: siderophore biosynthesis-like protein [Rhizobiales bacterium]|nr:siderophore biosynthesis-like protein [Hyphomicrobiales bacterium]MBG18671.1 siderophore biosynthesis-like protein [Hyphomicrobiales bacterium]
MNANRKRSVTIRGHRTSFSVEDAFWNCLKRMARERDLALSALIAEIDAGRAESDNLSSRLRLAVLDWALAGKTDGEAPISSPDRNP